MLTANRFESIGAKLFSENELGDEEFGRVSHSHEPFFAQTLNLMAVASYDGYFRQLNPAWEPMLGYTVDYLLSINFFELIHPEDRAHTAEVLGRLKRGELVESVVLRCRHVSGEYCWVLWTATAEPGAEVFYCSGHDITEQKMAEAELERSRSLLLQAYDIANIGYWEWEPASGRLSWSKEMYEFFGLSRGEFDGRPESLLARVHPHDLAVVEQWLYGAGIAESGAAVSPQFDRSFEYRLLRPDGTERVMCSRLKLVRDDQGELLRVVGTDQDITRQRWQERRLHTQNAINEILDRDLPLGDALPQVLSEVMHGLGFDHAELWLPASSGEHLELRHNVSVAPPIGEVMTRGNSNLVLARGEGLAGIAWRERKCVWRDDLGNDPSFIRREQARELGINGAVAVPVFGGEELLAVFLFFCRRRHGYNERLDGLLRSIGTQLARYHQAERVESRLKLLQRSIESISEGVVITDARQNDNPIIYCNPAFEQISGYRAEEVLGRNPRFLHGPESDRATLRQVSNAVEQGRPIAAELMNYRADGASYWCRLSIVPIRDEQGQITHFVGVQGDLTERRLLEQEYLQMQKLESIGRLAGGVAHDFNNLLTIILGYGEALLDSVDAEGRELTEEILRAGERAAGLTAQLLAFSRRQLLQPTLLDLNAFITDTSKLLGRLVGEDLQISLELENDLGSILADPTQLTQILMNLAVNARDAMPRGGTLTIETRNVTVDAEESARHVGFESGAYVLLSVSDTGCGMNAEVRSRLFEPFFTTKPRGKGTGMGLATVFGIVKQSGGHIEVHSEQGVGSRFDIYLPRYTGEGAARSEAEGTKAAAGGGTVLVVEDDPNVRKIAADILAGAGYQVMQAGEGREARGLAEAHGEPLNLLLSDVVMPGMSGPQVATEILKLHPECRVLFMSGYAGDQLVTHLGELGENASLLPKPFTRKSLLERVGELLEPRGEADDAGR